MHISFQFYVRSISVQCRKTFFLLIVRLYDLKKIPYWKIKVISKKEEVSQLKITDKLFQYHYRKGSLLIWWVATYIFILLKML